MCSSDSSSDSGSDSDSPESADRVKRRREVDEKRYHDAHVRIQARDQFLQERNKFMYQTVDEVQELQKAKGDAWHEYGLTEENTSQETWAFITRIRSMTSAENYAATVKKYGVDWWN